MTGKFIIIGSGGTTRISLSAWDGTYETVQDCTAALTSPPHSSYAVYPMSLLDLKARWKPTTETLTC